MIETGPFMIQKITTNASFHNTKGGQFNKKKNHLNISNQIRFEVLPCIHERESLTLTINENVMQ